MKTPDTIFGGRTFWIMAALICVSLPGVPSVAQNWTVTTAPSANWVSLASSADGNTLAALVEGGEAVYISTNAGADWTLRSPANGGVVGTGIACSADGKILYFAGTTQSYSSTNSLGAVLLSGDALLLNRDQLVFLSAATTLEPISPVVNLVLSKMTP